jgi:HPr kinase/phosphorylase
VPGGPSVHATALVIGEAGILLRGASGSGKTATALALLAQNTAAGRFAALVSDDRTCLEHHHGRLIARAPAAIAGKIEVRGVGVVGWHCVPACVLRVVVDLVDAELFARMPEEAERRVQLMGVELPRLAFTAGAGLMPLLLAGLHAVQADPVMRGRLAFEL